MKPPLALTDFQHAFGRYLRDPEQNRCPSQIPSRRAHLYETLLFNNLRGFLDNCFPVSRQLLSSEQWAALARNFFSQWRCHTPYFSQIPQEFVAFIGQRDLAAPFPLPSWLPALLHYEWVELEVELAPLYPASVTATDGGKVRLSLNPSLRNLVYEWPVHRIGREFLPEQPDITCLLVYRDDTMRVQFMEISPFTARLVSLAECGEHTPDTLLDCVLRDLHLPDPLQIRKYGYQQIVEFLQQGIFQESC